MNEAIRRAIAHAAVFKAGKQPQSHIYSYSEGRHVAFLGSSAGGYDYDISAYVIETGSGLYHYGLNSHVMLSINGTNISGFDYGSNSHFSGRVNGNSVQIYDHGDGQHHNYLA